MDIEVERLLQAVTERLELAPTSHVSGDVVTKVLVVADGAKLDGRCQMGSTTAVAPAAKTSGRRQAQPAAEPAAPRAPARLASEHQVVVRSRTWLGAGG